MERRKKTERVVGQTNPSPPTPAPLDFNSCYYWNTWPPPPPPRATGRPPPPPPPPPLLPHRFTTHRDEGAFCTRKSGCGAHRWNATSPEVPGTMDPGRGIRFSFSWPATPFIGLSISLHVIICPLSFPFILSFDHRKQSEEFLFRRKIFWRKVAYNCIRVRDNSVGKRTSR